MFTRVRLRRIGRPANAHRFAPVSAFACGVGGIAPAAMQDACPRCGALGMAGRAHVHGRVRMRLPLAAVAPRFAHVLWMVRFDVSFRRASTTSPLHTFVFHRLPIRRARRRRCAHGAGRVGGVGTQEGAFCDASQACTCTSLTHVACLHVQLDAYRRDKARPPSDAPAPPPFARLPGDGRAYQELVDHLTREKFQLERGLQAQRSLLDALAEENAKLAEAWNQHARRRDHADALQAEHEALQKRVEASDARAKRLADEVVALEDELRRVEVDEARARRENEAHVHTCDALRRERMALLVRLRELASRRGGARDVEDVERWSRGPMKDASTQTSQASSSSWRWEGARTNQSTWTHHEAQVVDEWHGELVRDIHALLERMRRTHAVAVATDGAGPSRASTAASSSEDEDEDEDVERERSDRRTS